MTQKKFALIVAVGGLSALIFLNLGIVATLVYLSFLFVFKDKLRKLAEE